MTMTNVEAPHASQNDVYDPDDVGLGSPLLKALKPKLEPTPSPPPELPDSEDTPPPGSPSSHKPVRRLKSVPSQGDAVLINLLGGGKALEVARTAATELLASDDEMSDESSKGVEVKIAKEKKPEVDMSSDLTALAMGALKFVATASPTDPARGKGTEIAASPSLLNGNDGHAPRQPFPPMMLDSTGQGMRHISPNLNITKGADELAPIQEPSPKSEKSNGGVTLPSIAAQLGDLTQLAEAATATASASKDTLNEHRPSISSISHSPPVPPLFQVTQAAQLGSHTSPPISPHDNFRRELPSPGRSTVAAASPYFFASPRRPSHEGPPYPAPTPGDYGSSSTETPSTDQSGSTPAGIPAVIDRMSIDGITNPQIGGFQCSYPGCSAQPFQTQYLLNSHANVHSSNRPHYCPVKNCPRGEGGKGFKRKNEMIRHGLVHESPGYVCPYCMDREHKYPRPDNLQRHVRVHHEDKDKDDPLLRDVLAQRPTGPSRGRRRRGGNS